MGWPSPAPRFHRWGAKRPALVALFSPVVGQDADLPLPSPGQRAPPRQSLCKPLDSLVHTTKSPGNNCLAARLLYSGQADRCRAGYPLRFPQRPEAAGEASGCPAGPSGNASIFSLVGSTGAALSPLCQRLSQLFAHGHVLSCSETLHGLGQASPPSTALPSKVRHPQSKALGPHSGWAQPLPCQDLLDKGRP